jgi:hypothetical protein
VSDSMTLLTKWPHRSGKGHRRTTRCSGRGTNGASPLILVFCGPQQDRQRDS